MDVTAVRGGWPPRGRRETAAPSTLPAWIFMWCALALAVSYGTYWVLGGRAFADFRVYSEVSDDLVYAGDTLRLVGPEGISRGLLRFFRLTLNDGDAAVYAMSFCCQALVAGAVVAEARRGRVHPANLLLAVACYAPLLALVTIRATPAYLLCAAGVVYARTAERPRLSWVLAAGVGALLFHISAAFVAAGAVVAALVPSRLSRGAFFWLAVGGGAAVLLGRQALDLSAYVAVGQAATAVAFPLLAERLVYFAELTNPVGVTHLGFFAFVSFVVFRLVLRARPHPSDRLVLGMYVLYCVSLVSPVVAVRNSVFFMLPLIGSAPEPVFPFGDGLLGHMLHVAAAVALLSYSLYSVLKPY